MRKAKRINKIRVSFAIIWSLCISVPSYGQDADDLFSLSLEDLMNIEITSASKTTESLFDAPVTIYSVSRDEILQAGITSIPEALRLVPGMIVRETTNGNYDPHIRGFDNVTKYGSSNLKFSTTTLIMVNGRPVFDHGLGGTYWERIPVDVVDIERIEVVRGPSAALYGPNAVTGIVNIITSKQDEEGVVARGSVQSGSNHPILANAYVGIKPGEKFDAAVSFNYQKRNRHDLQYYNYGTDVFVDNPEDLVFPVPVPGVGLVPVPLTDADQQYPNPEESMDNYGINSYLNYKVNEDVSFSLESALLESNTKNSQSYNSYTPLSSNHFESKSISLTGVIYGAKVGVSSEGGPFNTFVGRGDGRIDYQTNILSFEYDWKLSDKLTVRPGFNYLEATYDDTDYAGLFFGKETTVTTTSGSLRADYAISDQWRFVAAARLDKFSIPDDPYVSYQFASTYTINENNLLRAVVSRSHIGTYTVNLLNLLTPLDANTTLNVKGSDTDLQYMQMAELGYRLKIGNNLQLDLDVFTQFGTDFGIVEVQAPEIDGTQVTIPAVYTSLDLPTRQTGATLAVNYVPNTAIQIKPFITFQKTKVTDFPLDYSDVLSNPFDAFTMDLSIRGDVENESTPSVYGGFYANYKPTPKLNINLSSYFYGKNTQFNTFDQSRTSTIGEMAGKFILNAKVSYEFVNGLKTFASARNFTNDNAREFYGTDRIGSSYLGGVSFSF